MVTETASGPPDLGASLQVGFTVKSVDIKLDAICVVTLGGIGRLRRSVGPSNVSLKDILGTVGLTTASPSAHKIAFVDVQDTVIYGKCFFLLKLQS